jgi:hypothetical protein
VSKNGRVNSRSKGRGFEQKIATQFREALGENWKVTRNQTDRQGGQVEGSAGEFTFNGPKLADGTNQVFPWCVECKAHEDFEYSQLWTGTGPFKGFWEQACEQAAVVNLKPLLILKRNFGPLLAATWDEAYPSLPNVNTMTIHLPNTARSLLVMEFSDFIRQIVSPIVIE